MVQDKQAFLSFTLKDNRSKNVLLLSFSKLCYRLCLFLYLKTYQRQETWLSNSEHWLLLQGTWVWIPSPIRQFTTFYSSGSRSNTFSGFFGHTDINAGKIPIYINYKNKSYILYLTKFSQWQSDFRFSWLWDVHADALLHSLTVLILYSTTNVCGVSLKFYEWEKQGVW